MVLFLTLELNYVINQFSPTVVKQSQAGFETTRFGFCSGLTAPLFSGESNLCYQTVQTMSVSLENLCDYVTKQCSNAINLLYC